MLLSFRVGSQNFGFWSYELCLFSVDNEGLRPGNDDSGSQLLISMARQNT